MTAEGMDAEAAFVVDLGEHAAITCEKLADVKYWVPAWDHCVPCYEGEQLTITSITLIILFVYALIAMRLSTLTGDISHLTLLSTGRSSSICSPLSSFSRVTVRLGLSLSHTSTTPRPPCSEDGQRKTWWTMAEGDMALEGLETVEELDEGGGRLAIPSGRESACVQQSVQANPLRSPERGPFLPVPLPWWWDRGEGTDSCPPRGAIVRLPPASSWRERPRAADFSSARSSRGSLALSSVQGDMCRTSSPPPWTSRPRAHCDACLTASPADDRDERGSGDPRGRSPPASCGHDTARRAGSRLPTQGAKA